MKRVNMIILVMVLCLLSACGRAEETVSPFLDGNTGTEVGMEEVFSAEGLSGESFAEEDAQRDTLPIEEKKDEASILKEKFGENCITSQTFEVEMSEYEEPVYFVALAPTEEQPELCIQFVQDGKVVNEITPYLLNGIERETFQSLDAVSFWDINFDGYTDVALIMTYDDITFANIYYGFDKEAEEADRWYELQPFFSENLNQMMSPITIADIRFLISQEGKRQEFTDFREAYKARINLAQIEYGFDNTYDLIYFNEDDIPELVIGSEGYWVSMYTYHEGKIYTLMSHWGYGAMGNNGYEYVPYQNSLRNYNSDYAGAIGFTSYMKMNENFALEGVVTIETWNFDDVNENGWPDEEEMGSYGNYSVSYIGEREITPQEAASYGVGEYEYIYGRMTLEEVMKGLE